MFSVLCKHTIRTNVDDRLGEVPYLLRVQRENVGRLILPAVSVVKVCSIPSTLLWSTVHEWLLYVCRLSFGLRSVCTADG